MSRYIVTIVQNRITGIEEHDDEDEEALGIEWALSEMKDNWRHAKKVDASYSLASRGELEEIISRLETLLGPEAVQNWQDKVGRS